MVAKRLKGPTKPSVATHVSSCLLAPLRLPGHSALPFSQLTFCLV